MLKKAPDSGADSLSNFYVCVVKGNMGSVRCCLWVVSKQFLIDQFTGMPILSLTGVSLNEGEGEQRADGVGTELELK